MEFRRRLPHFMAAVGFATLLTISARAELTPDQRRKWEMISSGEHSFRKLGQAFYVDLPMRPVAGARLVFFNESLARRLGLAIPDDPRELEDLMISRFAVEIDPDPTAVPLRTMIATRYLDSAKKAPGQAMGDGRAVWMGELKIPQPDGKILSIDFVTKGVGATPFAWTDRLDGSHRDGKLQIEELVRSSIISSANVRNELDSTDDLMGFSFGDGRTSIVRAGNQTRIAHFSYFADEPAHFQEIFEYIVRRDLGYPRTTPVTLPLVQNYLVRLVTNVAEEAARYDDLDLIHGAPTLGNRTTQGSTIDLVEVFYQDANHQNFPYLYEGMTRSRQYAAMRNYLGYVLIYMAMAKYPIPSGMNETFANAKFDEVYAMYSMNLSLNRLGISEAERGLLTRETKRAFAYALAALRKTAGTEIRPVYGEKITPAAYDVRHILSSTFESWNASDRETRVLKNHRPWATPLTKYSGVLVSNYFAAVERIIQELSLDGDPRSEWIAQAKRIGSHVRLASEVANLAPDDPFYQRHDERIIRAVQSGNFQFRDVNEWIQAAANELHDSDLPIRGRTNLGPSPKAQIPSHPPKDAYLCRKALGSRGWVTQLRRARPPSRN